VVDSDGRQLLWGVLHVEDSIRVKPQQENGDGNHSGIGSPKGGTGSGATPVWRHSGGRSGRSMSSPEVRWFRRTNAREWGGGGCEISCPWRTVAVKTEEDATALTRGGNGAAGA
jgi:hypothetical protein